MASPVARTDYFCGLSGLQLPFPRYKFPEEFQSLTRLQYYATFFNSIEINSSFYKIPRSSTVARWAALVPENFIFTFKLSQDITHAKPFVVNEHDVRLFLDAISPADNKNGCLLIQFPPSLKVQSADEVARLLEIVRKSVPAKLDVAVEFRDKSWYQKPVFHMLASHRASAVIHDKANVPAPMLNPGTTWLYLRFHGPSGDYRGSYSDDFLYEYAGYIHAWLTEGRRVYVYFNNTMGNAFSNLQTLNSFLDELR